jgi:serine/threonine-protein kinase
MTPTPDPEPDESRPTGTVGPADIRHAIVLKGRYALGEELGRGGFAVTYLATDLELASRKVVVKILNDRHASDSWSLKKFRGEMEALARIDDPHVVGVLDFWESEKGQQFLVMQYVAGKTLRTMLSREGLPLLEVAEIIRQVGHALTAAHEAGVVHRDVKPDNIMIRETESGDRVKLIDFGVASIREAENPGTTKVCGTFEYMAPEQFEGTASPATDIYQMGIVAWEMLTGSVPFRGTNPASIAVQQRDGPKTMPRTTRPDLPRAAEDVLLTALALNPSDRFSIAREFGDVLSTALGLTAPPSARRSSMRRSTAIRPWTSARRIRRIRLIAMAVAGAVLLAAGAGYFLWTARSPAGDSVAVLPFENRTGQPELAYLVDGVTESLIDDLSRIPTLRVSARGSVLKYEGQKFDARAAGRELGVARIIDGSVVKRDGRLYVTTELIEVRTGARLWGTTYAVDPSSISDVLRQFSSEATDRLRLKLSGPLQNRLKRQYEAGSKSYEKYLKARFYFNKRTKADFDQAIQYFDEVLAENPDYAPALAGLSETYAIIAAFGPLGGGTEPKVAWERARTAANHALELDGTLAEAYGARATVEARADFDWAVAERDYLRSIELNPNVGETHEKYGLELAALGRTAEAIREVGIAEHLEPENSHFHSAHALILYMGRKYDEALRLYKTIAATPGGPARVADAVAEIYWMKGMPAEALNTVGSIPQESSELKVPFSVAALARTGQVDKARALRDEYYLHGGKRLWYYLALADLSMQRSEDAVRDLEEAHREQWADVMWIGVDPLFDPLRSNPGFHRLLAAIKLEPGPR